MKRYTHSMLLILIIIGTILRFYNLNWGAPYYFHPDERNIASAVSQLHIPSQMNPHFFAYGALPIYAIYFFGLISNFLSACTQRLQDCSVVSFEQAIIISRIFSAGFSVFLIPLLFSLGKKLFGTTAGLFTAALATFSVGFLQFARFGTFEMWLTFFSTLLFYLLFDFIQHKKRKKLFTMGAVVGILISVKISSLVLLPLPLIAMMLSEHSSFRKQPGQVALRLLADTLIIVCTAVLVYVLTNPFVLLDSPAFMNSMRYETSVAAGTLPVFYTQEFITSLPVLYHFRSVYPFLINPLLTILLPFALLLLGYVALKKRQLSEGLLLGFFLILFLSQAVLFVKWTRYLVPTLPFLYLILAGAGKYILSKQKRLHPLGNVLCAVVLFTGAIFSLAYIKTVFIDPDTRVTAATFAASRLPGDARILSEVYDLGIMPFNEYFSRITLFNFYELDLGSSEANPEQLASLLTETDYIILPSPRLYKTRTVDNQRFPHGSAFYSNLREENGYRKIYETPCDIFCRIMYLTDPVFAFEGSANVFDRPVVMIYQKL